MSEKFDPEKFKDEYHEKLMSVIQQKVAGVEISVEEEPAPGPAKVVDLMEVLKKSLGDRKPARPDKETTVAAKSGRASKRPRAKAR